MPSIILLAEFCLIAFVEPNVAALISLLVTICLALLANEPGAVASVLSTPLVTDSAILPAALLPEAFNFIKLPTYLPP